MLAEKVKIQRNERTHFQLETATDFSTKLCHLQTYQNYEQPPQTSQNSDFQTRFSVLKICQIFPKKFSVKIYGLGDQFY